jgi:hypothetical protein
MLAAIHALQGQKVDVLTTSIELSIPEVETFALCGLNAGNFGYITTVGHISVH